MTPQEQRAAALQSAAIVMVPVIERLIREGDPAGAPVTPTRLATMTLRMAGDFEAWINR